MSESKQETIADICGEIRQRASFAHSYGDDAVVGDGGLPKFLWDYADRIEAAYNRLAIPTPEQWTEFARQGSENERLRRALQFINEHIAFSALGGGADVVADAKRMMIAALAAASGESEEGGVP